MRLNIITSVLLFFMMLESVGAEDLKNNPDWNFVSKIDHGVSCMIAKRTQIDKKLIEVLVGMYIKTVENKKYGSNDNYKRIDYSKNSFSLNKNETYTYKTLKTKLKNTAKYRLYIYSKEIDIPDEVMMKSKYSLEIMPNQIVNTKQGKSSKVIFKKQEDLKTMTIGWIDPYGKIYKTNFCDIFFDEEGYGYLEYIGTGQTCNASPKKPKALVKNETVGALQTQSESKSTTQTQSESEVKVITQTQSDPKSTTQTQSETEKITQVHKNNKYTIKNDNLFKDEDFSNYIVTIVNGNKIENYTITYNHPHYYFSKSLDKSDAIILLKSQKPLYSLSKNNGSYTLSEIKRAFFIKYDSTFNLLKTLLVIKNNTYSPIVRELKNIKQYFNNLNPRFDLSGLNSLEKDSQYKFYIVDNENGNYSVVNDKYYLEWVSSDCYIKSIENDNFFKKIN